MPGIPPGFASPWAGNAPRPGRRELSGAAVLLFAFAALLYGPHVFAGGWYADDWALMASMRFAGGGGLGGTVEAVLLHTHRPGYAVIVAGLFEILGERQAPYLLGSVLNVGAQGVLLHALLRHLGFGWFPAGASALVAIAAPFADSTRLWLAAVPASVAVTLVLLAALIGLAGMRRDSWSLHIVALLLHALAILTYELVAPLTVALGVLYLRAGGRSRALRRWAVDAALAGACCAYLAMAAAQRGEQRLAPGQLGDARAPDLSPAHLLERADQTWREAARVFKEALPLDLLPGPLGIAVLVALGVAVGRASAGPRGPREQELLGWGKTAAWALLFAGAGLVLLLPAGTYYVPVEEGMRNRMGVAALPGAAVALTALALATVRLLADLAGVQRLARRAAFVVVAGIVFALGLRETEHQEPWAESWRLQQALVRATREQLPRLPPGAGVVTFRHPRATGDGVPVFATTWDLRGALRLGFDDPRVLANPFDDGMRCGLRGVEVPAFDSADRPEVMPYPELFFVDLRFGGAYRIAGPDRCRRVMDALALPTGRPA